MAYVWTCGSRWVRWARWPAGLWVASQECRVPPTSHRPGSADTGPPRRSGGRVSGVSVVPAAAGPPVPLTSERSRPQEHQHGEHSARLTARRGNAELPEDRRDVLLDG